MYFNKFVNSKSKRNRVFVFFIYSFLIAALISCDAVNEVLDDIDIFSDADNASLGNQLSAEIEGNSQEYPVFNGDPTIKSYINSRIFNHLLASSKITKKDAFAYELEIIDNDDILNAFALPGGKLYVYTGLLKYLDSEAALAGVIGHEIGHAEEKHATERMTKQYGVTFLLSMILGDKPSELTQIASNLFVGLAFLSNSRSQEDESDERSFEYLQDTRYYPGGVKFFFEKLRDDGMISNGGSTIETFLSTHPDPLERISETNQRLTNSGYEIYSWDDDQPNFYRAAYKTNILDKL